MNGVIATSDITLTKTEEGVIRIGNTRVSLDSVIIVFNRGATPEQIVQDYDTLTLPQVYAVISYYLHNQAEVDSYLIERNEQFEEMRQANNARFGHKGLREKLLARQKQNS
jgi:uncharacterized protein (DUF433 family)